MFFPYKYTILKPYQNINDYLKNSINQSMKNKMEEHKKKQLLIKDENIFENKLIQNNLHNKIFTITFTVFTWSLYFFAKKYII